MWKTLLLASLLFYHRVIFAADVAEVVGTNPVDLTLSTNVLLFDSNTPVFESSFVPLDTTATMTLASAELIFWGLRDTGFLELPQALQFLCLDYIDENDLYQFSRSRRVYQLIAKMYVCNALKMNSISIPATGVLKIFTFLKECFPKFKQAFPGFMQNRALSWTDVASVWALSSSTTPINVISDFCRQMPFAALLADIPSSEFISPYWIVAMRQMGKSVDELLKILLQHNYRQPAIYEYLLNQVPNVTTLQIPNVPQILLQLIDMGMYLPSQMDRPELMSYFEVEVPPGADEYTEFYDFAWEGSIRARNFEAFLAIIQMPCERFYYLNPSSLKTIRTVFVDPFGPTIIDEIIAHFDPNIETRYDSDSDESDTDVDERRERRNQILKYYHIEHDLMAVIASFLHLPGQHQEVFFKLFRTGTYDMRQAATTLLQHGSLEVVREIISRLTQEELDQFRPYREYEVLEAMTKANSLEKIEVFILLPQFTPFECFDLLNTYSLVPSTLIAEWIDRKDPDGTATLYRKDGSRELDSNGNTVDLLQYAVRVGNPSLVEYCLQRPQTRPESKIYARSLANSGDDLEMKSKF